MSKKMTANEVKNWIKRVKFCLDHSYYEADQSYISLSNQLNTLEIYLLLIKISKE